jgi:hypothetical protein
MPKSTVKIDKLTGVILLVANLSMGLVGAWYHFWPAITLGMIGALGSSYGLWFNGYRSGLKELFGAGENE